MAYSLYSANMPTNILGFFKLPLRFYLKLVDFREIKQQ